MGKLSEIYSSVENPLDKDGVLEKIISEYVTSSRPNLFSDGMPGIYGSLVKLNGNIDNSEVNYSDREAFFVKTYNKWIDSIISMPKSQINHLEKSYHMDAGKLQEYFKSFGKVSSMQDIVKLKSNPLFDKAINGWEILDTWTHVKSQYISGRTEKKIQVKHRLYVGCQNQDMWKLAELFRSKCNEQELPFYFKVGASYDRDDKMVIYADTKNLGEYVSVLQDIARENPEIVQRSGPPPMLTGKIDGWIGIGDEPPKTADEKNQSFNGLRANIFENSIEEVMINELAEYKGRDVVYNGQQGKFNTLFKLKAAQTIIKRLNDNKDKSFGKLSQYGLYDKDLSSNKLRDLIMDYLGSNIQKGIDKLIEVKDIKGELAGSNNEEIFSIPTRDGKKISIDTYDMDQILRNMVPVMQQIDPNFMNKVRMNIQNRCKESGIDDTFCFQEGSKERFEKVDEGKEKGTIKSKKTIKNRPKGKAFLSTYIAYKVNPKLLEKRIDLPNGTQISAEQYIQEIVAPRIPSSGRFILNNGSQISAKQYIEEYILGDGQEKYKGDIEKLLKENTRANDGTIMFDGEKILATDIADMLHLGEIDKKMILPNGNKISARQYVQEIVAPHIPADGKFILKSNKSGISARQFIQEFVMYVGQDEYNGDIDALIEEFTMPNDGTIADDSDTKRYSGQVLKQERGVSQAEAKRIEEQEYAEQERIEKEEKQEKQRDEKKGISEQSETIGIQDVKKSIMKAKVTQTETEKQTLNIKKKQDMFRISIKKPSERTAEEQAAYEEFERQKNEAKTRFRGRQHSNSKGMTM